MSFKVGDKIIATRDSVFGGTRRGHVYIVTGCDGVHVGYIDSNGAERS